MGSLPVCRSGQETKAVDIPHGKLTGVRSVSGIARRGAQEGTSFKNPPMHWGGERSILPPEPIHFPQRTVRQKCVFLRQFLRQPSCCLRLFSWPRQPRRTPRDQRIFTHFPTFVRLVHSFSTMTGPNMLVTGRARSNRSTKPLTISRLRQWTMARIPGILLLRKAAATMDGRFIPLTTC